MKLIFYQAHLNSDDMTATWDFSFFLTAKSYFYILAQWIYSLIPYTLCLKMRNCHLSFLHAFAQYFHFTMELFYASADNYSIHIVIYLKIPTNDQEIPHVVVACYAKGNFSSFKLKMWTMYVCYVVLFKVLINDVKLLQNYMLTNLSVVLWIDSCE